MARGAAAVSPIAESPDASPADAHGADAPAGTSSRSPAHGAARAPAAIAGAEPFTRSQHFGPRGREHAGESAAAAASALTLGRASDEEAELDGGAGRMRAGRAAQVTPALHASKEAEGGAERDGGACRRTRLAAAPGAPPALPSSAEEGLASPGASAERLAARLRTSLVLAPPAAPPAADGEEGDGWQRGGADGVADQLGARLALGAPPALLAGEEEDEEEEKEEEDAAGGSGRAAEQARSPVAPAAAAEDTARATEGAGGALAGQPDGEALTPLQALLRMCCQEARRPAWPRVSARVRQVRGGALGPLQAAGAHAARTRAAKASAQMPFGRQRC
jgi:hypothetical protein